LTGPRRECWRRVRGRIPRRFGRHRLLNSQYVEDPAWTVLDKLFQVLANLIQFPKAQLPGIVEKQTTNPPLSEMRNAFDTRVDMISGNNGQIFACASLVDDPQFIPGPFNDIADGGAFQNGDQTALSFRGAMG
jgi:hypothetical protein